MFSFAQFDRVRSPLTVPARPAPFRCAIVMIVASTGLASCASQADLGTSLIGPPNGYVLTSVEQGWHCDSLTNAVNARVTKIAALNQQAKTESETTAPTVSQMFTRMFGAAGTDNSALQKIKPERSAAEAYNGALRAKGCPMVEIDAKVPVVPTLATASKKP